MSNEEGKKELLEVFEMLSSEDNVGSGLLGDDLEAFVRQMVSDQFHIAVDANRSIEILQINRGIILRRGKTFVLSSRLAIDFVEREKRERLNRP